MIHLSENHKFQRLLDVMTSRYLIDKQESGQFGPAILLHRIGSDSCRVARDLGYTGKLVVLHKTAAELADEFTYEHPGLPPLYLLGDVVNDMETQIGAWTQYVTPLLWNLCLLSHQDIAEKVLESIWINNIAAISNDQDHATAVTLSFGVSFGNTYLHDSKQRAHDAVIDAQMTTECGPNNILNDVIKKLDTIFNRMQTAGIHTVNWRTNSWHDMKLASLAYYTDQRITAFLYRPCSTTIENCVMVCLLFKLTRQQAVAIPRTKDRIRAPDNIFPGLALLYKRSLRWRGLEFSTTSLPTCRTDSFTLPSKFEVFDRWPSMLKYKVIIPYLFVRLQLHDTRLEPDDPTTHPILFPFKLLRKPIWSKSSRTLLTKPTQSMKTMYVNGVLWVYIFVRGFHAAMILRSIQVRETGLIGFKTKGIDSVNSLIRQFLDDVADQLPMMGITDINKAKTDLTLSVISDMEAWGPRKGTMAEQQQYRDNKFDQWLNTIGTIWTGPMNPTGLDKFKKFMHGELVNHTVVAHDEADEFIGNQHRNKDVTEKLAYPTALNHHIETDDTSSDLDVYDDARHKRSYDGITCSSDDVDEEAVRIQEVWAKHCLASVAHMLFLTATPHAVLYSYQGNTTFNPPFFCIPMDVDPLYVGSDTPDYVRQRIQDVSVDYVATTSRTDDWGTRHGANIRMIQTRLWDPHSNEAALIVGGANTSHTKIAQHEGAFWLADNPISRPIIGISCNGNETVLYLGNEFYRATLPGSSAVSIETLIREHLRHYFTTAGYEIGNGLVNLTIQKSIRQRDHCIIALSIDSFEILKQGLRIQKRHPTLLIEIVLALFQLLQPGQPAGCFFLESQRIAGREKTYTSFDRSFNLSVLYYNSKAQVRTALSESGQTQGRISGVVTSNKPRYLVTNQGCLDKYHRSNKQNNALVAYYKLPESQDGSLFFDIKIDQPSPWSQQRKDAWQAVSNTLSDMISSGTPIVKTHHDKFLRKMAALIMKNARKHAPVTIHGNRVENRFDGSDDSLCDVLCGQIGTYVGWRQVEPEEHQILQNSFDWKLNDNTVTYKRYKIQHRPKDKRYNVSVMPDSVWRNCSAVFEHLAQRVDSWFTVAEIATAMLYSGEAEQIYQPRQTVGDYEIPIYSFVCSEINKTPLEQFKGTLSKQLGNLRKICLPRYLGSGYILEYKKRDRQEQRWRVTKQNK